MEQIIKIDRKYSTLEELEAFLQQASTYEIKIDWDGWEQRIDEQGQLEKCLIIKKSNMHGVKLFFVEEGKIKLNHIIPNKIMNAYFGVSQEAYRTIFQIITGKIKSLLLAPSQEKAFKEIIDVFKEIKL